MPLPHMSRKMAPTTMTSPRQVPCRGVAKGQTGELFSDEQMRREANVPRVYEVQEAAVAKVGGPDAFVALLDEKPSYLSTVSKCLNRADDSRRFPVDWHAALLLDREAATEIIHGYAAIAGLQAVVSEEQGDAPAEEKGAAAVDVLRDLERAGINTRDLLTRKLGRKPGSVRL